MNLQMCKPERSPPVSVAYYYDLSGELSSDHEGNLVQLCERCRQRHADDVQLAQAGDDESSCELCDESDDELEPAPATPRQTLLDADARVQVVYAMCCTGDASPEDLRAAQDMAIAASRVYEAAIPKCAKCGATAQRPDMWPSDIGLICQDCWEEECSQAWWEVAPTLPTEPARRRIPLPTEPYAPRPVWARTLREKRYGQLRGRRAVCLGSIAWYRQARRCQMPTRLRRRQFAALNIPFTSAALVAPLAGPAPAPDCAWCGGPAERAIPNACTALCPACLDAWLHGAADTRKGLHLRTGRGRRARYTQTLFTYFDIHRRIRSQRINRRTYLWKRRTRFYLRAGTLHYLACRRYAAQVCRLNGYQRIKPGVWFDPSAGYAYLQADSIEPAGDWITMGAA